MLLKVLEEPPSNTTFILVTDYIDKVMPTIKSRCQSVYVPRLTNDSIAQFFTKNNQLSSNFISFITDNNLNALNSLNSFDKEEILDCIKIILMQLDIRMQNLFQVLLIESKAFINPQEMNLIFTYQ